MATLNGGVSREDKVSVEDRALIEDFLRTKTVQKLQPAELDGSEISRGTHDRIIEARKVFRENKRKINSK